MRNEVIFDSKGIPDIMVVFTPEELGLPTEIKGRVVKEYAISKYPNTIINGVPYSMPYQKPEDSISHDKAIQLCEAKGPGWHLMTNDEWAALAHQSRRNGTIPHGNTEHGKSHSHPNEIGVTQYEPVCKRKTLAGSGPVTWNHDHTAEGVADMCGNIWEHVGGIRFMDGQVQVIPDNGAAAGADQSRDSKEWRAIHTADGDPVYYKVKNRKIILQPVVPDCKDYDCVEFKGLIADDMDVPEKMIELGLYPAHGYKGTDYFFLDNEGEKIVSRGGSLENGERAGMFSLNGYHSRTEILIGIGFRSALVRHYDDLEQSYDDKYLNSILKNMTDSEMKKKSQYVLNNNFTKLSKSNDIFLKDMMKHIVKHVFDVMKLSEIFRINGYKNISEFIKEMDEEIERNLKASSVNMIYK